MAAKKIAASAALSTPAPFSRLLIGVSNRGALTFFPVLSLGPIVEHLLMNGSRSF